MIVLKSSAIYLFFLTLQIALCFNPFSSIFCYFKECCSEEYIPSKFEDLYYNLLDKVYGQPLVQKTVTKALRSHWDPRNKPSKPLTLSFHGGPGSGKNYVSKFIVENLYQKGFHSEHVHNFMSRVHFPEEHQARTYGLELYRWIKGNVTRCPKQLFIFDEVEKMPRKILDFIKPVIDYHSMVDGVDYRQSIFIFLSNTGQQIINEHFLDLWKSGRKREDIGLNDFEKLITMGAFNEEGWLNQDTTVINNIRRLLYASTLPYWYNKIKGGFHKSDTIKSNLIDHYIPFLPLELEHVESCILDEFKKRGVPSPPKEYINEVLQFLDWGPDPEKVFSKTGCKRISQKVGLFV